MSDKYWKEFEEVRAEVLAYAKDRDEALIKTWLNKIGYKDKNPIGYFINLGDKTIELYSTRPGVLIGKAGVNIQELMKMLSDEFRGEWKVKFVEIRGGFVTV